MQVHLVDAHVLIFRAYHALPAMSAPDGTPTHAAYGFASTLARLVGELHPSHLACCFDFALTSFRNRVDPGYKEGRTEPPPDLEPQFDLCVEVSRALGIAAFAVEDFEADDVIATLTERLLRRGAEVVVVSSDKDLAQLVRADGRVVLLDFARGRRLDAAGVRARFGVDPEQIPDYLGLVGDAIDHLPGVPGIGPRTAAALLGHFGSLSAIPGPEADWSDVPVRGARIRARVEEHRERAELTRDLATLRRDVPGLAVDPEDLRYRGADPERVDALCDRLGWGEIATRLRRLAAS